jgi:hypothetical protein
MDKLTLLEILDSTEAGEEITRHTLEWHYRFLQKEIELLLDEESLEPYEAEDLENNRRCLAAIKTTLEFFGIRV